MQYSIRTLTNKYVIAGIIFILLILFSDKGNLFDQIKLYQKYRKVKAEHAYYATQIEKARKEYHELFSNEANLEKFAREKYLMKRDDEDVFVIIRE